MEVSSSLPWRQLHLWMVVPIQKFRSKKIWHENCKLGSLRFYIISKHTIFGRVRRGMEIIKRLGSVQTDNSDGDNAAHVSFPWLHANANAAPNSIKSAPPQPQPRTKLPLYTANCYSQMAAACNQTSTSSY